MLTVADKFIFGSPWVLQARSPSYLHRCTSTHIGNTKKGHGGARPPLEPLLVLAGQVVGALKEVPQALLVLLPALLGDRTPTQEAPVTHIYTTRVLSIRPPLVFSSSMNLSS